jgi:hypothetical protein
MHSFFSGHCMVGDIHFESHDCLVGFGDFLFEVSEVPLQHFAVCVHADDFLQREILRFDSLREFVLFDFELLEVGG